jgi:hypothetical protein
MVIGVHPTGLTITRDAGRCPQYVRSPLIAAIASNMSFD